MSENGGGPAVDAVMRAVCDPGSITPRHKPGNPDRDTYEPLNQWQRRAVVIALANHEATALDGLERQIRSDMDDMEKHSTAIATGLYRALRFVQMAQSAATEEQP